MKYFLIEAISDSGRIFLKTNASDKETAINNFCSITMKQIITILNLNIMKTPEFYIETTKTGTGHYLVTVTDEANNEIKSYTETDMQVIDALNDEDGELDMTQWDATQIVIRKAGFEN